LNAGGASGTSDWTFTSASVSSTHGVSGGLAGGAAGFNWQISDTKWVFGAEADFAWADISGDTSCYYAAYLCQSKLSNFATGRGRLGYAAFYNHVLLYGTAGMARASDQIQTQASWLPAAVGSTGSRVGWTAGAGIEYAFWGPLTGFSTKIEYLRYDLGSANTTVAYGIPVLSQETGNIFRAGLNWKFIH
jgi:outer membrane immunogenic protein